MYVRYTMKRYFLTLSLFFLSAVLSLNAKSVTPADQLSAYYERVDGKSGKNLFDEVHTIAKIGYSSLGYDGLWTAYEETDLRQNGNIWDMYSNCSFTLNGGKCGNYSRECDCYNREHSIPKSWFGDTKSSPGCDIFHLVPTDGKVNGMRSNYPFGEVSSATYTSDNGSKLGTSKTLSLSGKTIAGSNISATCSGKVFEPIDEYKGDFARGYFGTMIKWAGDWQAFTDANGSSTFSDDYTASGYFGLTKYGVALLLKWHREDPVSQKEIDRNNGIQKTQGNRNPFIDYPYLAEYIWGEKAGEKVELSRLVCSADDAFVPGQSNGYNGQGGSTTYYTVTWYVDGGVYTAGAPTTSVRDGGSISVLPTVPAACNDVSETFMGWTDEELLYAQSDAPALLFSTVAAAPKVKENTAFYAVFAHKETTGVTEEEENATYILDYQNTDTHADWTVNEAKPNTNYWILTSGSSIASPAISYAALDSIDIRMRTYGGATYSTVDMSMGETAIGSLSAGTNKEASYMWRNKNSLNLTETAPVVFASTTNTASNGPGIYGITVYTHGKSSSTTTTTTYSGYTTTCSETSTSNVGNVSKPAIRKVLRDGQLFIIMDGVTYTVYGTRVE